MRVSEDRYNRDLRRVSLANRLIDHGVRTMWVSAWTGLKARSVRNLNRSYRTGHKAALGIVGRPPKNPLSLLRSALLQNEASALAGIAARYEILPKEPLPNAHRALPGLVLGETLCRAFDLYRTVVSGATFTMEQFMLLVVSLAERRVLVWEFCEGCRGVLVVDAAGARLRRCPTCRKIAAETPEEQAIEPADLPSTQPPESHEQHSLF